MSGDENLALLLFGKTLMSKIADAFVCFTWYTNSMKECEKPSWEQSLEGFCYVWR